MKRINWQDEEIATFLSEDSKRVAYIEIEGVAVEVRRVKQTGRKDGEPFDTKRRYAYYCAYAKLPGHNFSQQNDNILVEGDVVGVDTDGTYAMRWRWCEGEKFFEALEMMGKLIGRWRKCSMT